MEKDQRRIRLRIEDVDIGVGHKSLPHLPPEKSTKNIDIAVAQRSQPQWKCLRILFKNTSLFKKRVEFQKYWSGFVASGA